MNESNVNVEVITKIIRDMLRNHPLEAVLIVRDAISKEVLYEACSVSVVLEDQVSFKHIVGAVEISQV